MKFVRVSSPLKLKNTSSLCVTGGHGSTEIGRKIRVLGIDELIFLALYTFIYVKC